MFEPVERIDYKGGGLDDVAVSDVSLFRMEWMNDRGIWIRLYREGKPDIVISLSTKESPIMGTHEFDS